MKWSTTIPCFLFLLITGCIEPFVPKTGRDAGNILVVDGSIDPAGQIAQVRLSRTIPLDANINDAPDETFANVSIEELNGSSYDLTESNNGVYTITGINFNAGEKYRLIVRTSTGETYESEYAEVTNTP